MRATAQFLFLPFGNISFFNDRFIMLVIRLARKGAKGKPSYSLVATDSRKRRDSGFIERVGHFDPMAKYLGKDRMEIKLDRVDYWLKHGAQLSDRVKALLREYKKIQAAEVVHETPGDATPG